MTAPVSPYADLLARVPVRSRVALLSGEETAWWDYGPEDRPVDCVMIHGFRGDHHGLEPFVAALGPNVRILIPDLPGFGLSAPFSDEASIDRFARWLREFMTEHAPGAAVLGHSFGSIVVAAARARGLAVPATILVNPISTNALSGPRGIMTRLAVLYYRLSAALPERWGFALLRNRAIVRVMSSTMAKSRDSSMRRWIHDQHDRYFSAFGSRRAVLEAFTASISHDVSEYTSGLTGRLLLIVAAQDDITPLHAQMELAARIPDSDIRVIEHVGHLIHYEAAHEAAGAIAEFLSLPGPAS